MKNTETKLNGVEIAKNKAEFVYLEDLQPGDAFKLGDGIYVRIQGMYNDNLAVVELRTMQLTWMPPQQDILVKNLIEYLEINTARPYVNIPYIKWPDDYNRQTWPVYPWYSQPLDLTGTPSDPLGLQPERQFTYCNSQLKSTADLDMKDHMTWAVNRKD